jgi:deoxyribose-phosphate aldolase
MSTAYSNNSTKIDSLAIERSLGTISLGAPTLEELQLVLSCIDLTTLEGKDTDIVVQELCKKAVLLNVGAVCVYPALVKTAKTALKNTGKRVASVAGGFPAGQLPLYLKLEEVKYAIGEGADEIDLVISRKEFLQQNHFYTRDEVAAVKAVCGNTTLKVILETGELETLENIALASRMAIAGGADFIKTSTGKINGNATLQHVYVMLMEIKAEHERTGKQVGIKPSGGIADGKTAAAYLRLVGQILGKTWMQPGLFRIGASRLASTIAEEIQNNTQHATTFHPPKFNEGGKAPADNAQTNTPNGY